MTSGLKKALATISTGVKLKYHVSKGKNWQQAYDNSMPILLQSKILFNPYLNYSYFLILKTKIIKNFKVFKSTV